MCSLIRTPTALSRFLAWKTMAIPIYISVRIKSMKEISSKAVLLTAFDGSEDIFPKSVIFGYDSDVEKCEALWIAAWILPKKKLQYSPKKSRSLKALGGLESDEVLRLKQITGIAEAFRNEEFSKSWI